MIKICANIAVYLLIIVISVLTLNAQQYKKPATLMKYWTKTQWTEWEAAVQRNNLSKIAAGVDRRLGMHNGNKLRTLFYNYGSIGRPNTEPSIEWPIFSGHGYAYEFGALVGAEVIDNDGDTIQFFSDAMLDGGDTDPTGGPNTWGWEPISGWAVDNNTYLSWPKARQDKGGIAVSNKPDTWGDKFEPNPDHSGSSRDNWTFKDAAYLWPGQFGKGEKTADFESFYKMDDRFNAEFDYSPYISDPSISGLGVEITVRGYQYAASLAEDIIFFIHEVTNISEKDLEKTVVGMVGDPHIGGAGDFSDDFAGFVGNDNFDVWEEVTQKVGSLVYAWDNPGSGNDYGLRWEELGWLAFKFLESPGNSVDGIDNDNDGMIDESRSDGIDNDDDWDLTDEEAALDTAEIDFTNGIDDDGDGRIDDLGDLDGKSDDLDGDGVISIGDNDFDQTDLDESDQLGLTSFAGPVYGTETASQDDVMWVRMTPGNFASRIDITQNADNIFIFGSGYFPLAQGQTEKFSVAVLIGLGKEDMLNIALTAEKIFRLNFKFTSPPDLPTVWAVSGDRKVTLYWDDIAEKSVDPIYGEDFEGYKIYRSTSPENWGPIEITDNQGLPVGYLPIAQFDLVDGIDGIHPVEFARGLHFDSGSESGLTHVYVDSPLTNDITYHYAVASYDKGSVEANQTPLESSKSFGSPNVVSVTPRKPAAGFYNPKMTVGHSAGISTGSITARIIDPTNVDTARYEIEVTAEKNKPKIFDVYTVSGVDTTFIWEDIAVGNIVNLWNSKFNVGPYEVTVEDEDGIEIDTLVWSVDNPVLNVIAKEFSGGVLLPRDLEVQFFDRIVDTSVVVNPQPIKFRIINVYDDSLQMSVVFFDIDGDGEVTKDDRAVALDENNEGTWEFLFVDLYDSTSTDTIPRNGEILKLFVSKPFETGDKYFIFGTPAGVLVDSAKMQLDKIAVIPNPYVAASSYELPPSDVFSIGRGERRINFINLPQECTIRIYTIAGEHIRTIEHNTTIFSGTEGWNLLTKDGMDVAFGIYIYHISAPGIGEKIGRIAIIK